MSVTDWSSRAPLILLGMAAVGWYAAAKAAANALANGQPSPGRRAAGHCLPVAVVAILAIIIGRPEIAVGVIFASSVACLTLVLGIVTLSAGAFRPRQDGRRTFPVILKSGSPDTPIEASRESPTRLLSFLLPVVLIVLLIGFSSAIGRMAAAILAIEGLVLLIMHVKSQTKNDPDDSKPVHRTMLRPSLQIGAALLTAGVASWAGVRAARDISDILMLPGCGLVTALMVSPALVLSMIGSGSSLASAGKYEQVVTTQVCFVMFNLCAVLPLSAALWIARPYWQPPLNAVVSLGFTTSAVNPTTAPATTSTTLPVIESAASLPARLPFPMAVWRVDTVLLVAVALLLLPVSLGRWSLGGGEGLALLLVYAVYMVLTTAMAR